MAFGDVKTPQGLKELNNFLADNSYISGYELISMCQIMWGYVH